MLSIATSEAKFYFFTYKMKAAILSKDEVTVKEHITKILFSHDLVRN